MRSQVSWTRFGFSEYEPSFTRSDGSAVCGVNRTKKFTKIGEASTCGFLPMGSGFALRRPNVQTVLIKTNVNNMKNTFFFLAVLLFATLATYPQAKRDKPYDAVRTADFANFPSCFFRGWANYYDADTVLVDLRKGQKIEVSIGWRELPTGETDPLGPADLSHHGFTIFDPAGRILNTTKNKFVITARMDGTFKIIVKPYYRTKRNLAPGAKPADYDYRLDMTLYHTN